MDDLTAFERRFADRVRAFAASGVQPFDPAEVARAVVAGRRSARRSGLARWTDLRPIDRRAWTIAVALALLVALAGGALLVGSRLLPPPPSVVPAVTNAWIAITVSEPGPDGSDEDRDIWLVALDVDARRVVGSDSDRVQELCPAFSPDGRNLAYGRVEGHGTRYYMNDDGTEGAEPAAFRQAAAVVADVGADGRVSDRVTIDLGDGRPPPCPLWSPDGTRLAFAVNRTSPNNPETSAAGSEVRVVALKDRSVAVLPDLLAMDLDWSPDGRFLAIVSGNDERAPGEILQDGRVHLYAIATGAVRTLDETHGAAHVSWAPDGRRIAWTTGDSRHELRVIDVETGEQEILASGYEAIHGIGPVWSPDGERIAYQRTCARSPNRPGAPCREQHEVVLVTPGGASDEVGAPTEVVVPFEATTVGSDGPFFPFRVTWSPDGSYLLYVAWQEGRPDGGTALVAVPADLDGPAVVLARMEGLSGYDGYPDATYVPTQVWGRTPAD